MRASPFRPPVFCFNLLVLGLLTVLVTPAASGSGSKKRDPIIAIRFYGQVPSFDPTFTAKVKVGTPPREVYIEKIPSISERDVASFYPYRSADGSYSVVLQLDRHGSAVLEALSAERIGMVLIASVSGRLTATLKIDKPISDGIIFIPSGLTVADIRAMGASFSLMGETDADREARRERAKKARPSGELETGAESYPSPTPR